MKESILDVLMYLFDRYVDEPQRPVDAQLAADEMLDAGFDADEVDTALDWFQDLRYLQSQAKQLLPPSKKSFRVYSAQELQKISEVARRYLLFLEQSGIVDPLSRELVINRVMALPDKVIDATSIKWIVLLVLFDQPELKDQLTVMEELMFNQGCTQH